MQLEAENCDFVVQLSYADESSLAGESSLTAESSLAGESSLAAEYLGSWKMRTGDFVVQL